jgi:hypothetical protein
MGCLCSKEEKSVNIQGANNPNVKNPLTDQIHGEVELDKTQVGSSLPAETPRDVVRGEIALEGPTITIPPKSFENLDNDRLTFAVLTSESEWKITDKKLDYTSLSTRVTLWKDLNPITDCVLSYRCDYDAADCSANLLCALRQAGAHGFKRIFFDKISIEKGDVIPETVKFSQLYHKIPVIHYYSDYRIDSCRIWIVGEIVRSYMQENQNFWNLRLSPYPYEKENVYWTIRRYGLIQKVFIKAFNDDFFDEDEVGQENCVCWVRDGNRFCNPNPLLTEASPCPANKHHSDHIALQCEYFYSEYCNFVKPDTANDDMWLRNFANMLNPEGGKKFPAFCAHDLFYNLRETYHLFPITDDEMRQVFRIKHTCLGSEVQMSLFILALYGELAKLRTKLSDTFPVRSPWMNFIMNLILDSFEEFDPAAFFPVINPYIEELHGRYVRNTYCSVTFMCIIMKTSDAVLLDSKYRILVLDPNIFLGSWVKNLSCNISCNCDPVLVAERMQQGPLLLDQFTFNTLAYNESLLE